MNEKEFCEESCQFTIHPCNFEVNVKEIKPFHVYSCKPIILDLRVISSYAAKSFIAIKSKPAHGNLCLLSPSTLIYKSFKGFIGIDVFQILIEDEYCQKRIENIFVRVIN